MRVLKATISLIPILIVLIFAILLSIVLSSKIRSSPIDNFVAIATAIGVLLSLYSHFSDSAVSNTISRRIRFANKNPLDWYRSYREDTDETDEESSLIGEAAPLEESDRHYESPHFSESVQFRPYEVLDYLSDEARENLIDDAWTQTMEMWKNRRPEDYNMFKSNAELVENRFNTELLPDDDGCLRLKVIPSYSRSQSSEETPEQFYDLIGDIQSDFHSRIVDLAVLHDGFEP